MASRPFNSRRCAGLTTIGGLLVGAIAAAPTAAAASRPPAPQHIRFTVHGVVVASRSHAVTVFASDLVAGRRTEHNRRVTIAMNAQTKTRGLLTRGHTVQVSGTAAVTPNATVTRLTGLAVTSTVTQLHFYLGQVSAVGAGTLTVTKDAASPSDDPNESGRGSFSVDVSDAAVTVDGETGKAAVGDQVAVVGFSTKDSVVAMAVYALTTVTDAVLGTVSSVSGSTVTVSVAGHPCSDEHDGDTSDDRDGDDGDDDGDGHSGSVRVAHAAFHRSYEHDGSHDGWHGSHDGWHGSHDGWHGSHDGWHGSHDGWRDGWHHGDRSHSGQSSVAVDVSDSLLVVDGQSDAATSLIKSGDQLVAFGSSTSTGMAAALTLVISASAS